MLEVQTILNASYVMSPAGGADPALAEVFSISTSPFRSIRLLNLVNGGFATATRINEIAFRQAAVPEPSSLVFSISALGLIALRRRRKAAKRELA